MPAPERTCPSCGTVEATLFDRCRACGAAYDGPAPSGPRRWPWVLAGAIVLIASIAGAVALLDRADSQRETRTARYAELEKAEIARLTRVQAPKRGAAAQLRPAPGASDAQLLKARRALVEAVEASVLRDARARVRTGELEGPLTEAVCGPLVKDRDAVPDDRTLAKKVGRFDCTAVREPIRNAEDVEVAKLGYAFVAALDFTDYTYVWCRNTPAQGERGKALGFVRLERACLAARGRVIGTGYADVPDS